jgi:hypothetical protein
MPDTKADNEHVFSQRRSAQHYTSSQSQIMKNECTQQKEN